MKPGPWKNALGVLLILVVVVLWVGSSFFVKYVIFGGVLNISNGNVSEDGYDIPYYLTYLCNSLFIVYLPIVGVKNLVVRSVAAGKQKHRAAAVTTASPNDAHAAASKLLVDPADGQPTAVMPKGAAPTQSLSGLPSPLRRSSVLRHTMKWALIVCPFWFAANGTYNVSQGLTSVTSNSIISSTSGLFTFILSFFFTHETFTVVKLAGIFLSIGGACVVALKDSGEGSNDLLGDLVCLLSAFLYGCYTTLIDKGLPDDGQSQPALFFGFLGLFNAAIFGAGLALVYGLQWEKIQDVPLMIVGLILVKAAFDNVLSDYIWVRSMMLLSPTIATIGLTLTIPLSIIVDSALGTEQPDARTVVGAVLMVCGFVAVTYGKDPAFLASCCRCSGHSFADCRNARYSRTQSSSDDNEDDDDVAIDHTGLEEDDDDENDDGGASGNYGDDTSRRRQ